MMRRCVCVAVVLATALPLAAEEPLVPPTKLTLRPAGPPTPALKYQLLPEVRDQTPGNAALLYYRSFSPEWLVYRRQPELLEKAQGALTTPLKELNRTDLDWLLTSKQLQEVDLAARREFCDWETMERIRKDSIAFLLPDVQEFRNFASLLAARARLHMADGHYDKAIFSLQTSLALARHVSEGPTLIQSLVAAAITAITMNQVEELIQAPNSPNLYWALTTLPRPYIDLRKPLQFEATMLEGMFPEFKEMLTTRLTQEQMRTILDRLAEQARIIGFREEAIVREKMALVLLAVKAYPMAKRALIAGGRKPEDVEAMPAVQVVLIHSLQQYQRLRDDSFKWIYVPYPESVAGTRAAERQLKEAKASLGEGVPFASLLLPAITKVYTATARTDRRIAILRCIEAIRLHAAAHDGKLPAALSDIKEVPVPLDPVTGKMFEYKMGGNVATLYAPPPSGETAGPQNAMNYELTLQR